ncbi:phospholipid/cholesterol/gamma-HCH transport system substrate-binding protein [Nocardioides daedukensis]|uniref:Phospholipid/cholesterol/gamma-HCH transport system substrate-binding protein n=1 Tax=Nocardioides daedukensis TaxID=634462 RepID=A0A7Y9RYX1_9ACTN|nr:MlaD family protein [Nocardioides daedukensis]NYG58795.1 phospholipid/cholesterol/gamma-HCH transport system substrate-binding protein [Nocardioides daedukensis]
MITKRTKIQLVIFVVITLVGVTFVGARYARLDRLFYDDTYTVTAHFKDSGGIFSGAEVSYRGVTIGRVGEMELTEGGVDVHLDIEKDWDKIPADSIALVGNRSAVGEQYVELQPKVDDGPYLRENSEIDRADTKIPIATSKLLEDISNTVSSVDQDDLRTTVSELGKAFDGTGEDLAQIIDTSNAFIETANDNFDITTALIRDANTVLTGQLDKVSAIRTFSSNLALFSTTLAGADKDLRGVIDKGSGAVNELRTFIEVNQVDLASLLNNLVTVSRVVVRNLDGVEQLLTLYPHIVEAGFTVVAKDPETGNYDAHFGLILTPHKLCHNGYEDTDRRNPFDTGNRALKTDITCKDSAAASNARGAQNLRRAPVGNTGSPIVAEVDRATGEATWLAGPDTLAAPDTLTARTSGEESWKWLLLRPLQTTE